MKTLKTFYRDCSLFLAFSLFLLFTPGTILATEATFAWNPNPEINLSGYKIHFGVESGLHPNSVDVGSPAIIDNTVSATLTGFTEGTTYYFVATAYDVDGFESNISQEIAWTAPATTNPDYDNDGMLDTWEINYNLNPNNANDAGTDLDNDGYNNLEEFLAGTNPIDVEDHPSYIVFNIANIDSNWQTIETGFSVPSPVTINGSLILTENVAPAAVLINTISHDSFNIKLKNLTDHNPENLTGNVPFIMLPGGRYINETLIIESGSFNLNDNGNFTHINFIETFPSPPMIFLTIQSANSPIPLVILVEDITGDGFNAAISSATNSHSTDPAYQESTNSLTINNLKFNQTISASQLTNILAENYTGSDTIETIGYMAIHDNNPNLHGDIKLADNSAVHYTLENTNIEYTEEAVTEEVVTEEVVTEEVVTEEVAPTYTTNDFSSDNKADILLRHTERGQLWLFEMDGNIVTASNNIGGVSPEWTVTGVADFTGDNKADILLRHTERGQLWLFEMDGNTVTASNNIGGLSPEWTVAGVADFSGDNKADILLRHTERGQLWLFEMDANSVIESNNIGGASLDWNIVANTDYNGDHMADILLQNQETGLLWLFGMNHNIIENSNPLGVVDLSWNII